MRKIRKKKMWRDENAFGGDWAMFFFVIAMFAATVVIVTALMGTVQDIGVKLMQGDMDVEVVDSPLVKSTYNWTSGLIMAALGFAIAFVGVSYYIGALSPDAAAKSKGTAIKLLLAICIAPVVYIPLRMIVELNLAIVRGFLSMSSSALGGESLAVLWGKYFGVSTISAYNFVPTFGMIVLGLATALLGILVFRLIFLMISYSLSPLAVVLCAFPQTEDTGKKLIKIFFESTFGLLFLDISIMFTFGALSMVIPKYGANNPALWFLMACAGLSFPLAFYKIMFNPIGNAVGRGLTAGMGAISGSVSGLPRAVPAGGRGGAGGVAGAGGAGGAKAAVGKADKLMATGKSMMQQSGAGIGALAGATMIGAGAAFKAGQRGKKSIQEVLADRKDVMSQMKESAAARGFLAAPGAKEGRFVRMGIRTPREVGEYKKAMPIESAEDLKKAKENTTTKRAETRKQEVLNSAPEDVLKIRDLNSEERIKNNNAAKERINNDGRTLKESEELNTLGDKQFKFKQEGLESENNRRIKELETGEKDFDDMLSNPEYESTIRDAGPEGKAELGKINEKLETRGLGRAKMKEVNDAKAFLQTPEAQLKGLTKEEDMKLTGAKKRLSENPTDAEARDTKTQLTNKQSAWEDENIRPRKNLINESQVAEARYKETDEAKDRERKREIETAMKQREKFTQKEKNAFYVASPEGRKELEGRRAVRDNHGLTIDEARRQRELGAVRKRDYIQHSGRQKDMEYAAETRRMQQLAKSHPELIAEANEIDNRIETTNKKLGTDIAKLDKGVEKVREKETKRWEGDRKHLEKTGALEWAKEEPPLETFELDKPTRIPKKLKHEVEWKDEEHEVDWMPNAPGGVNATKDTPNLERLEMNKIAPVSGEAEFEVDDMGAKNTEQPFDPTEERFETREAELNKVDAETPKGAQDIFKQELERADRREIERDLPEPESETFAPKAKALPRKEEKESSDSDGPGSQHRKKKLKKKPPSEMGVGI